jgi:hypothetical protein
MLSLEMCRQLLGPTCPLKEEELLALRQQLYALAEAIVTNMDPGGGAEARTSKREGHAG